MNQINCPSCGAPQASDAVECAYCGAVFASKTTPEVQTYREMPVAQSPYAQQPMYNSQIDPSWPVKNKTVAGLLALFLGSIGVHEFYLGHIGRGILYLLFCWTYIPACIAFFQGISYLVCDKEKFQIKHRCRLLY